MESLAGKKLLLLGATNSEIYLMNEARKHGMYVIVTDNHTDWSLAPAKHLADDAWDISWSDIDALAAKCKECGVDGVFAAYSEERVLQASKLTTALGLPFYATTAQMMATRDKLQFKALCRECGIGVTPEYSVDLTQDASTWDVPEYPVIVKPVDNAGARGITVCYNREELVAGIHYALDFSQAKQVVIEKYLTCTSIGSNFYVQNGEVSLIGTKDKALYSDPNGGTPQPTAHIYPSIHSALYEKELLPGMRKMVEKLGIQNGTIFVQSFTDGEHMYVFEMGFRINGGYDQVLVESEFGIDVLYHYYMHSIYGKFGTERIADKVHPFEHIYVTLSFPLHNGTIAKIVGFDEMQKLPEVIFYLQSYAEGDEMNAAGTYAQLFGKFFLKTETAAQMQALIAKIKANVDVIDTNGNSMIADAFDETMLNAYKEV